MGFFLLYFRAVWDPRDAPEELVCPDNRCVRVCVCVVVSYSVSSLYFVLPVTPYVSRTYITDPMCFLNSAILNRALIQGTIYYSTVLTTLVLLLSFALHTKPNIWHDIT